MLSHHRQLGMDTRTLHIVRGQSSATYSAVLEQEGSLAVGIACMSIFGYLQPRMVLNSLPGRGPDMLVVDANSPEPVLAAVADHAHRERIPIW